MLYDSISHSEDVCENSPVNFDASSSVVYLLRMNIIMHVRKYQYKASQGSMSYRLHLVLPFIKCQFQILSLPHLRIYDRIILVALILVLNDHIKILYDITLSIIHIVKKITEFLGIRMYLNFDI